MAKKLVDLQSHVLQKVKLASDETRYSVEEILNKGLRGQLTFSCLFREKCKKKINELQPGTQVQWHMSVISEPGRQRQKNHLPLQVKASLVYIVSSRRQGYTVRHCLKNWKGKKKRRSTGRQGDRKGGNMGGIHSFSLPFHPKSGIEVGDTLKDTAGLN